MDDASGAAKARDPKFDQAVSATARKNWQLATLFWRQVRDGTGPESDRKVAGRRLAEAARKNGDLKTAEAVLKAHLKLYPNDKLARRELAVYLETVERAKGGKSKYWANRQGYIYLTVARTISERIASNAKVIADIGSNGTPILEWFPHVPVRFSVDLNRPYKAKGIKSVKGDFLEWEPPRKINVLTCFQVMEHVPRADLFAQKMLSLADTCIVSVPYNWPEDKTHHHIHDPVDEAKMLKWFGREPNYTYHVREIFGEERMICVYDRNDTSPWTNIDENRFRFRWSLRGAESIIDVSG